MPLSPNLRAAVYMAVSMAGFTCNDVITKSLTDEMNTGQILFLRGAFATLFIFVYAWQQNILGDFRKFLHPLVLVRAFAELFGAITFVIALGHMPIANVSAILQSLPLAVTVGAALFFGEKVRWRRWVAILVGFAGVLIIVRPGFGGFSSYAVWALVCVGFCAVRDLATRRLPQDVPSLGTSLMTAAVVCVFGGLVMFPMGGWTPINLEQTGRLAAAAALLIPGYIFIVLAMRTGDVAFVAPFRYTALLWSMALGAIFFAEIPEPIVFVGAALVIGSGLYSLYRENVVGRGRPITETSAEAMAPDGT